MRKTVQPKTGETHKIFGLYYQKQHKFDDSKWQPTDKIDQYDVITLLYQKDLEFRQVRFNAENKKRIKCLNNTRHYVENSKALLKAAIQGDVQRNKNMFKNHRILQRLYQNKRAFEIAEKMDQRTFTMRKELDRLIHKKRQLSEKYQIHIMELAKIQNRIKYEDVLESKDRALYRKMSKELKNSETRMRPIRKIQETYGHILVTLKHDAVYFDSTIRALHDDLKEQNEFIETTVLMGGPALQYLEKLNREFDDLDRNTRFEQQEQMNDILAYRKMISGITDNTFSLVRRDVSYRCKYILYNEYFHRKYAHGSNSKSKYTTS